MYCGVCPFCGRVFRGKRRDVVRIELQYHMIEEYYSELLSEAMDKEYCKMFGEITCVTWWAGVKAYHTIKPC